ncbi:hypothetical protein [Geobacter sp.]|uniref:hypothetical protein n=1 Tax=Geobacter sp. TaxID=46610 RepID=UPI0026312382|nr:hypothetical protein [Geobacter sp.]
MNPVAIDDVRNSAVRIIIRLALGNYLLRGPGGNILELESRVAWATVVNELHNEGYVMVTLQEYAAACSLTEAEVVEQVEEEGSLFALFFPSEGEQGMVVPLEREEKEHLGPLPL